MTELASPMFLGADASDSDTVSLHSTVASEEQEEYNVERIMLEQDLYDSDEGKAVTKYLVKWEGYALQHSTFEPRSSFTDPAPISTWNKLKKKIAAGQEKPFDLQKFEEVQQRHEDHLARRRARRNEKRREAGWSVNSPSEDLNDEDTVVVSSESRRKRRRITTELHSTKKGIARKRAVSISSNDSTASDSLDDPLNSQFSLWNERTGSPKALTSTPAPKNKQTKALPDIASAAQEAAIDLTKDLLASKQPAKTAEPKVRQAKGKVLPSFQSTGGRSSAKNIRSASVDQQRDAASQHKARRTPAPPVRKAPATKMFIDPAAQRKSRIAMDSNPLRESTTQKYKSISHQYRSQKFGQRELPPEPEALKFFDLKPKTAAPILPVEVTEGSAMLPEPSADDAHPKTSVPHAPSLRGGEHDSSIIPDARLAPTATTVRAPDTGTVVATSAPAPGPSETRTVAPLTIPTSPITKTVAFELPSVSRADESSKQPAAWESQQAGILPITTTAKSPTVDGPPTGPRAFRQVSLPSTVTRSKSWVKGNVTCRRWLYAQCTLPHCAHAHMLCADSKKQRPNVCSFWQKGRCMFQDDECPFTHPTSRPSQSTLTTHEVPLPGRIEQSRTSPLKTSRGPEWLDDRPSTPKDATCREWCRQRCLLRERDCRYAHRRCDWIEPKAHFQCRYWKNGHCHFSAAFCRDYHDSLNPDTQLPTPTKRFRTCADWLDRSCSESAESCRFYHAIFEPKGDMVSVDRVEKGPKTSASVVTKDAEASASLVKAAEASAPLPASSPGARLTDAALQYTAILKISSGAAVYPMLCRMKFDTHQAQSHVTELLGQRPNLSVEQIASASDCKQFHLNDNVPPLATGELVSSGSSASYFDAFVDYLILHSATAIMFHQPCCIMVYPAMLDDFQFLQTATEVTAVAPTAALRFHVQTGLPMYKEVQAANVEPSDWPETKQQLLAQALNIVSSEDMLFVNASGRQCEKRVYLFFPSPMNAEARVLRRYLQSLGAEVFTTSSLFRDFVRDPKQPDQGGVIIFHASVQNYWEVQALYQALFFARFNILQFGIEPSLSGPPSDEPAESLIRIFSGGSAYLLTDDVFVHYPQKALDLISFFDSLNTSGKVTVAKDHIVVRPNVEEFLVDLLAANQNDYSGHIYRDLLGLIDDIVKRDGPPGIGTTEGLLISPGPHDCPNYAQVWNTDQRTATNELVAWFAGWGIASRESIRQLQVVYDLPDSVSATAQKREWTNSNGHIWVATPEKSLEGYKKSKRVLEN